MDIEKSVDIKEQPAIPRWRRGWIVIVLTALAGLLTLGEITFQSLRSKGWTTYTSDNSGLAIGVPSILAIDEQGRVWVGTDLGRLSVLNSDGSWTTYTTDNSGLVYGGTSMIEAMAIDAQGRVWLGTAGGLGVLNPDGSWTTYTSTNSDLPNDWVNAVAVDAQGSAWVGTDSGLSVLAPDGSWTTYTSANSDLPDDIVEFVAIDAQGRVWVGTFNSGLSVLTPDGGWTTYTPDNSGLVEDSISTVVFDRQGRVWLGTWGGLSVLDPDGGWTSYTTANSGLANDNVLALAIDGQGQAWMSTFGGGVSLLSPDGSWTSYTTENSGLADNLAYAVVIDTQGQVWVGTNAGLSTLDPEAAKNLGVIAPLHFYLPRIAIPILIVLAIVWGVQRWRLRPKKVAAPSPAPQPAGVEAVPPGPAAALEAGSTPIWVRLLHSLVGALVSGLAILPIAIICVIALDKLLFNLLGYSMSNGIEDFYRIVFYRWPAVGLGAIGGFIGSVIACKPFKRIGPWIGAASGGLIVALLTIISTIALDELLLLHEIGETSDLAFWALVSWLPAFGLGALGGFIGSALARTQFERMRLWIGAAAGGLAAVLLTIISMTALEALLLLKEIGGNGDAPNLVFWALVNWLPAVGLGALGGFVGSALARRRFERVRPWIRAATGGLMAALLIALLMTSSVYADWMAAYKKDQAEEMRPESNKPTPLLVGDFKVLTAVPEFESLAISSDGKLLAIAANQQITFWDIEQNKALGQKLTGHTMVINDLELSSDGRWLVSGGYDQKVMVWSVPDGEQVFVLKGHNTDIMSVAVNSRGTLAASGDVDGTIILWDLMNRQELARFETKSYDIPCLDFSPDGKLLAVNAGDLDRFLPEGIAVTLWDVTQHQAISQLGLPRWTNGRVKGLSFSPDGRLLAGAASFGPVVWDVQTRTPLGATQRIETNSVIDFSPDGRSFVFTSGSIIYIHDSVTREPVGKLAGPSADSSGALFLPNGQLLAWYLQENAPTQIGIWTIETP